MIKTSDIFINSEALKVEFDNCAIKSECVADSVTMSMKFLKNFNPINTIDILNAAKFAKYFNKSFHTAKNRRLTYNNEFIVHNNNIGYKFPEKRTMMATENMLLAMLHPNHLKCVENIKPAYNCMLDFLEFKNKLITKRLDFKLAILNNLPDHLVKYCMCELRKYHKEDLAYYGINKESIDKNVLTISSVSNDLWFKDYDYIKDNKFFIEGNENSGMGFDFKVLHNNEILFTITSINSLWWASRRSKYPISRKYTRFNNCGNILFDIDPKKMLGDMVSMNKELLSFYDSELERLKEKYYYNWVVDQL